MDLLSKLETKESMRSAAALTLKANPSPSKKYERKNLSERYEIFGTVSCKKKRYRTRGLKPFYKYVKSKVCVLQHLYFLCKNADTTQSKYGLHRSKHCFRIKQYLH